MTAAAWTSAATAHATFKGCVTIAVVRCFFLSIFQDLVSLVRFFELFFGLWIVRVAVWMQLFCFLAVSFLDLSRAILLRPLTRDSRGV